LRILLVDDSIRIRDSLRSFLLAQPGVEICGEAADGLEAIEKARGLRPDLIVLDLSMPLMNGFDAGDAIHRDVLPQVPLILFTFHKDDAVTARASAAGFRAVVSKEDGAEFLFAEIRKLAGVS
jgi:DNA-binding NarL/FixJ family response regulator